jgi:cob(I)alamin adenosyltransferase
VIALSRREKIGPFTIRYLNRLSDALFVLARAENHRRGVADVLWNSRK